MKKNIISAVGSEIICQELAKRGYSISSDIPYQDGLIQTLKNEMADVLIFSTMLEGEKDKFEIIEEVRKIDKVIKVIVITNMLENNYKIYLSKMDINNILIDGDFLIEDVVKILEDNGEIENETGGPISIGRKVGEQRENYLMPLFQKQQVITVSGTEGAGKSSFIVWLADILGRQTHAKILVMDMDTINGGLNKYFGVGNNPNNVDYTMEREKNSSINYMINAIDKRSFNTNEFERYLIKVKKYKNLFLMSGNKSLYVCKNTLSSEYYLRIFEKAKQLFDIILMDTSSNVFLDSTQFAINCADRIFFVTEANNNSISRTVRILNDIYNTWQVKNEKISIIINKVDRGCLGRHTLEEFLNTYKIKAYIGYNSIHIEQQNNFDMRFTDKDIINCNNILKEFNLFPESSFFEEIKRRLACL